MLYLIILCFISYSTTEMLIIIVGDFHSLLNSVIAKIEQEFNFDGIKSQLNGTLDGKFYQYYSCCPHG